MHLLPRFPSLQFRDAFFYSCIYSRIFSVSFIIQYTNVTDSKADGQTPHDGIGGAYAYRRGEIKAEMLIDSTECYVCLQGSEDGEHHVGRVTAEYQVDR